VDRSQLAERKKDKARTAPIGLPTTFTNEQLKTGNTKGGKEGEDRKGKEKRG